MGILADILELVEKAESGKERATPEEVLALALRNGECEMRKGGSSEATAGKTAQNTFRGEKE